MKRGCLLVVWVIALVCAPWRAAAGQGPEAISGKWGVDGNTLLDLSVDSKGNATGTIFIVNPSGRVSAPISVGTFDAASGRLKISGDAKRPDNAQLVPYTIEARLADGKLAATYDFGGEKGSATLVRIGSEAPKGAAGAGVDPGVSAVLQKQFAEVSGLVARAAETVPADKYSYKPVPTVRSFAQLVNHIADSYKYYCATSVGRKVEWSDAFEKGGADKSTVMANLKEATAVCTAALKDGGAMEPMSGNIAHTNLHYGNMITYMRMLGLVPPSS